MTLNATVVIYNRIYVSSIQKVAETAKCYSCPLLVKSKSHSRFYPDDPDDVDASQCFSVIWIPLLVWMESYMLQMSDAQRLDFR